MTTEPLLIQTEASLLGCPKNLVDSERILTELRTEGYDVDTLLRCMNQLEKVTKGTIEINGHTLVSMNGDTPEYASKEVQKKILMETGFVFQNFNLFPQ